MYVERANEEVKHRKEHNEAEWERTRVIWSLLMNAHFKKSAGGKYVPQDLIKLSFDKEEVHEKPNIETFDRLVKRHAKRGKKKNVK